MFERFFRRRGAVAATDEIVVPPAEEVPEHLEVPLLRWVVESFNGDERGAEQVAIHLRMTVEPTRYGYSPIKFLYERTTKEQLPAVIDAMLSLSAPPPRTELPANATPMQRITAAGIDGLRRRDGVQLERRWEAVEELDKLLTAGGSGLRVNADRTGLESRIGETAFQGVNRAVAAASARTEAGSAGQHLAAAWAALYGRNPDPSKSYSESIKAVEAAAQAVVEPRNAKATLGTMLKVLERSAPGTFSTAIEEKDSARKDVDLVVDMMRRLWQGQTSRHGSQAGTTLETKPQAEMAVFIAMTLVEWFSSGHVRRNP